MIAHNPLHGSGQAEFPHPALALGEDAQAMQGIGMTDGRHGQPASDEAPHAVPEYAAVLTAPRQRAVPEPPYWDRFMPASLKFGFHLVQLRLQLFANRLPQHREPSIAPLLHTDVRKAQEVERLQFLFSTPLPGPMWVPVPPSYDFCIHYTSPV
jgi:hypothetical protein